MRRTGGSSSSCSGAGSRVSTLALVRGRPRSRAGRIEAPIGRDRRDPTRHSLDTDTPRDAVTGFEVVELLPAAHAPAGSRSRPAGRTRSACTSAAIDLPVAGDPSYGVPGDLGLDRQFLHAERLAFPHPVQAEPVDVRSPLPPELAAALDMARTGDAPALDRR